MTEAGDAERVVRKVWAAMARGDRASAAACFSPDIVWHLEAGQEHAMSGDYVGWQQNGHLQKLIREESRGSFHAEATEVHAVGPELVVATIQVSLAVGDGDVERMPGVWVARVLNGRVVEVWDIIRPVPAAVLQEAARAVATLGRLPA